DGQRVYLSDGVSGVTVDSTGKVLGPLSDKEFAATKWGTHQMPEQTQGLIPIAENGKHGYLSPSGAVLVPPLYDNISVVGKDGGYFLAQKDQTWGIFDRAGKVIFPFLFPNAWYVEETGDIYAIHGGFLGIAHSPDYLSWSHYAGQTVPMGPAAGQETVSPVENPVLCDGAPVKLGAYLFHDGKGGVNYVKLRDVAHLLAEKPCRFAVNWTAAEGITLSRGTPYSPVGGEGVPPSGGKQPYRYNRAPLTIDGTAVLLDSYVIGQNTYFKLRDLGDALGFTVGWSAQTGVTIATAGAGGR
ncbi:MAG: WG repeat-containing protein, partial [Oscillospiraceae bacterium]